MHPVPLVELAEKRRGESVVMLTITAGVARRVLRTAKAAWAVAGELEAASRYEPLATRQAVVTIFIDRMRRLGDNAAIPSNLARQVLVEVGVDASCIGQKLNSLPARRVFTPRDHRAQ